jgi:hypothetical protein
MKSELFIALKALESVREIADLLEESLQPKLPKAKLRVLRRKARIVKDNIPKITGDLSQALRAKRGRTLRIDKKVLEEPSE